MHWGAFWYILVHSGTFWLWMENPKKSHYILDNETPQPLRANLKPARETKTPKKLLTNPTTWGNSVQLVVLTPMPKDNK